MSLLRGSVDATSASDRQMFNPLYPLPSSLTSITRIDRGYISAADSERYLKLEYFDNEWPVGSWGRFHMISGITSSREQLFHHDESIRGGVLGWSGGAGSSKFWQANFTGFGEGIPFLGYRTLDIRVDRWNWPPPDEADTDFSISLVNANGTQSNKIRISDYVKLRGPAGGAANPRSMLQTARIPLTRFTGVDLAAIRALRFTFDRSPSGKIAVAHIRLGGDSEDDEALASGGMPMAAVAQAAPTGGSSAAARAAAPARRRITQGNQVLAVRPAPAGRASASAMEIEVATALPFPVTNALLVLQVGEIEVKAIRTASPDLRRVVFTLSRQQYAAARDGDRLIVSTGGHPVEWDFGPLAKR